LYGDDDTDDADDFGDHVEPMMIHPYELPYDDEHVASETQSEFDVPDEFRDEIPGHYESNNIVDQLLEEIDIVMPLMILPGMTILRLIIRRY
jgi:hypothetical protein